MRQLATTLLVGLAVVALAACGGEEPKPTALVKIKNDFNNPEMARKPQWTLCRVSYLGVDFGKVALDETSAERSVTPGLGYVLMVAAWEDPTCSPEKSLPIASKNEEEVMDAQSRTIAINMANHQGPCPPEGVAPIPEAQYDKILELWPDLGFKPYAERTQNPQCLP